MILDEKFEMPIARPVRVSHGGDFVDSTTLVFLPPQPKMARETFKMERYFTQIKKEVGKFLAETAPGKVAELQDNQSETLQAGDEVQAIHEGYSDDSPEAKEAKLKDIEESIAVLKQAIEMCADVDFYQMTVDFGKMIATHRRGSFKGKNKAGEDATVPITLGMWENDVDHRDRLEATLRYCCFFDLTSSLQS